MSSQVRLFRVVGLSHFGWLLPIALGLLWIVAFEQPTLAAEPGKTLPPVFQGKIDYRRDILPILSQHCYRCHGPQKQESGLRMDSRAQLLRGGDLGEPTVRPGKSQESFLIRVVAGLEEDIKMPPKGPPLSAQQIGKLRAWIDQGWQWPKTAPGAEPEDLPATQHWAFQPIVKPAIPPFDASWGENPIDAFVLEKLRGQGLQPSARADRRTLIRRLYLVISGLPPTPAQVDQFVNDVRPDAYERLVDRVLASPQYGERWARHWLDVVRFGETHGFETNRERPHAWRYRDYVITSFNRDLSYQKFVKEQIAGDAYGVDVATSFLVAGPYDLVKSPDVNLTLAQRQDELADMVNTTGTTFLGLTLGCARCHNHKYDPVTQRDFYSVQAVFAGVEHADRSISTGRENQQQIEQLKPRIGELQKQLEPYVRTASSNWVLIDDATVTPAGQVGVEVLVPKRGDGINPAGTERGYQSDPGGTGWVANVSQGRYTWWVNKPGENVLRYRLMTPGRYRVWISWGMGHESHSTDAQYWLDADGDLKTTEDQQLIAEVDQQHFADGSGKLPGKSLWSGFRDTGVHQLRSTSVLILRSGKTGTAVTADVVLLESAVGDSEPASLSQQPAFRPAVNFQRNVEKIKPRLARRVRFTILETSSGEPCIDELEIWSGENNVALASQGATATCSSTLPGHKIHQLKHINDGRYGNRYSWISNERGQGWVQIEFPQTVLIDRLEWGRDRESKIRDRLATRYKIEVSVEADKWVTVATGRDRLPLHLNSGSAVEYQFEHLPPQQMQRGQQMLASLQAAQRRLAMLQKPVMAYAGRFKQPGPTHRLYRGEPLAKREQVNPDTVEFFGTLSLSSDALEQQRRTKFADWIVSPDNPLTARVLVNRLWHYHFGAGLVVTPSDFGTNGAQPSHPRLLDWLAGEFMDRGWSVKQIQRLVLTSATFCQQSTPRVKAVRVDADSRWLWRFPPRRLEAEAIRDSLLFVAGSLDWSVGGPGFSGFEVQPENVRHYFPKKNYGPADWRRMVYMTKVRQELDSVFGLFDCPDGNQVMPKRSRSTTPLQALNLFNSNFVLQQAEMFSQRLEREAAEDVLRQVKLAFLHCFGREPSQAEQEDSVAFVRQHGLAAFCRALSNSNEFILIP